MSKVNYVIACWTGARRADDPRARRDRTFVIRQHLWALEQAQHNLDQITIVLAEGGDEKADAYIKSLTEVNGTPVVVLPRENTGYSYASWNHAFDTFGRDFDYYIIIEDDYAPWAHRFDEILVGHAEKKNTYVCSLASRRGRHGAISNGVIPSAVWEQVHPAPYTPGAKARDGNRSQVDWTFWFCAKGFPLQDHTDTHSSPFWLGNTIRWYGDMSLPPLLMPVDALHKTSLVSNLRLSVEVTMNEFGAVEVNPNHHKWWQEMVEASASGRTR